MYVCRSTVAIYVLTCTLVLHEPGVNISCDACSCDLTHSIRIKCADPVCVPGEGVDICPSCFCAGKEFARHKRGHAYRVIVSLPLLLRVFCAESTFRKCTLTPYSQKTGVPTSMCFRNFFLPCTQTAFFLRRELLLLTGVTTHGVGNWKKIAEHIGTRTKEEVEEHYRTVYVESPNWPLPVCPFSCIVSVANIIGSAWTFPLTSTPTSFTNANDAG